MRPISPPVRPPTFPRAPAAADPAFEIVAPADEVTRDRPSCAFFENSAVLSLAALAASEVDEEALRTPARWTANVERRSTARDAARDMSAGEEMERRWGCRSMG